MKQRVIVKARFIPRAQTLAEWEKENPILLAGEHGVVTDGKGIKKEKIGDGVTSWNKLEWWGGASAYDVAVAQGFEGTESEWLTSLKGKNGDVGPQGDKGDKGDAFRYEDLTDEQKAELKEGIEQCIADQTYDPTSENAQSGTAVAEAVKYRIPKFKNIQPPYPTVSVLKANPDVVDDEDGNLYPVDSSYSIKIVDDGSEGKYYTEGMHNAIAARDFRGNLWTGEPVDDEDCVNKKYANQHYVPIKTNTDFHPYVYVQEEQIERPTVMGADRIDGYMEAQSENGGLPDGDLSEFGGFIARRKRSGNLISGMPNTKHDVANKMYVDDAIANVENGGSAETWEVISDTTTEFDTPVSQIVINQDTNGNSFSLKKMKVFIDFTVAEAYTGHARALTTDANFMYIVSQTFSVGNVYGYMIESEVLPMVDNRCSVISRFNDTRMLENDNNFDFNYNIGSVDYGIRNQKMTVTTLGYNVSGISNLNFSLAAVGKINKARILIYGVRA